VKLSKLPHTQPPTLKKERFLTGKDVYLGSPNLFSPQILFFCDFKPLNKFQNTTITPSGRKVARQKREREKRKNVVNSGHLVP
jgi:hypothetical protein